MAQRHMSATPSSRAKRGVRPRESNVPTLVVSSLLIAVSCAVLSQMFISSIGKYSENIVVTKYSLLEFFANTSMEWGISTTPIPITTTAALIKSIFAAHKGINDTLVPFELRHLVGADTIRVHEVRQYINSQRFRSLQRVCNHSVEDCKKYVNEADPEFGITPLHLARAAGDDASARLLESLGADPDRFDRVNRKPQNLSFSSFVANSKKAFRGRSECDFPSVSLDTTASEDEISRVLAEIRRLVSEGEPILIRKAAQFLNLEAVKTLNVETLVEQNADVRVSVGEVPYASYFGLPHSSTTLKDYFQTHVKQSDVENEDEPLYVFQKSDNVTQLGLKLLSSLLLKSFPVPELMCPVDTSPQSSDSESIHFFLGAKGSGAPFHIHADAVNMVLQGAKRWFIYPPQQAIYSRKHISRWISEDYSKLTEAEKPLECIQRSGDVVYIPFDWGHAVLNLEDQTFGYALELLNRREVFASLPSQYRRC